MKDPERLRTLRAGQAASHLLDAARADVPPHGSRMRALVALGVSPSATDGDGDEHASNIAAGKATLALKWLGMGVAVTLAAATVYWVSASKTGEPPLQSAKTAAPQPIESQASAPPEHFVVAPAGAAPALQTSAGVESESVPLAKTRGSALTSRTSSARLSEEVAALDAVRAELAAGAGERSLLLLDKYARKFPSGELAPEATVLRVEALLASGHRSRAEKLARELLRANPESHYSAKIAHLLDRLPAP